MANEAQLNNLRLHTVAFQNENQAFKEIDIELKKIESETSNDAIDVDKKLSLLEKRKSLIKALQDKLEKMQTIVFAAQKEINAFSQDDATEGEKREYGEYAQMLQSMRQDDLKNSTLFTKSYLNLSQCENQIAAHRQQIAEDAKKLIGSADTCTAEEATLKQALDMLSASPAISAEEYYSVLANNNLQVIFLYREDLAKQFQALKQKYRGQEAPIIQDKLKQLRALWAELGEQRSIFQQADALLESFEQQDVEEQRQSLLQIKPRMQQMSAALQKIKVLVEVITNIQVSFDFEILSNDEFKDVKAFNASLLNLTAQVDDHPVQIDKKADEKDRRQAYLDQLQKEQVSKYNLANCEKKFKKHTANLQKMLGAEQNTEETNLENDLEILKRKAKLTVEDLGNVLNNPNYLVIFLYREDLADQFRAQHQRYIENIAVTFVQLNRDGFARIPREAILSGRFEKAKGAAPELLEYIENMNRIKCYVTDDINAFSDIDSRTYACEQWIRIAQLCFEKYHDYHATMAILAAFISESVFRQKKLLAGISAEAQQILQALQQTMSNERNSAALREHVAKQDGIVVPYVGIYNTDITFAYDGDPLIKELRTSDEQMRLLEDAHSVGKKVMNYFDVMQERVKSAEPLAVDDELVRTLSSFKDTEEFKNKQYDLSLQNEPRVKPDQPSQAETVKSSDIFKEIDPRLLASSITHPTTPYTGISVAQQVLTNTQKQIAAFMQSVPSQINHVVTQAYTSTLKDKIDSPQDFIPYLAELQNHNQAYVYLRQVNAFSEMIKGSALTKEQAELTALEEKLESYLEKNKARKGQLEKLAKDVNDALKALVDDTNALIEKIKEEDYLSLEPTDPSKATKHVISEIAKLQRNLKAKVRSLKELRTAFQKTGFPLNQSVLPLKYDLFEGQLTQTINQAEANLVGLEKFNELIQTAAASDVQRVEELANILLNNQDSTFNDNFMTPALKNITGFQNTLDEDVDLKLENIKRIKHIVVERTLLPIMTDKQRVLLELDKLPAQLLKIQSFKLKLENKILEIEKAIATIFKGLQLDISDDAIRAAYQDDPTTAERIISKRIEMMGSFGIKKIRDRLAELREKLKSIDAEAQVLRNWLHEQNLGFFRWRKIDAMVSELKENVLITCTELKKLCEKQERELLDKAMTQAKQFKIQLQLLMESIPQGEVNTLMERHGLSRNKAQQVISLNSDVKTLLELLGSEIKTTELKISESRDATETQTTTHSRVHDEPASLNNVGLFSHSIGTQTLSIENASMNTMREGAYKHENGLTYTKQNTSLRYNYNPAELNDATRGLHHYENQKRLIEKMCTDNLRKSTHPKNNEVIVEGDKKLVHKTCIVLSAMGLTPYLSDNKPFKPNALDVYKIERKREQLINQGLLTEAGPKPERKIRTAAALALN